MKKNSKLYKLLAKDRFVMITKTHGFETNNATIVLVVLCLIALVQILRVFI